VRIDPGHHLGRVANTDGGQVRAEQPRHDPDTRQVSHGEARRRAGLQQLSGCDEPLHHGASHGRADGSADVRNRPSLLDGSDGLSGNVQREECPERSVAIGLGIGGVGLSLLVFALRDAVVLDQVLVQVGKPTVGTGGGEGFLIGADGRREIRRIHDRQGVALADLVTLCDEQARHGTREGCQYSGGLIVVEVNRTGALYGAPKPGRRDRIEMNVLPLGGRQSHIASGHSCWVAVYPGGTAADGEDCNHC